MDYYWNIINQKLYLFLSIFYLPLLHWILNEQQLRFQISLLTLITIKDEQQISPLNKVFCHNYLLLCTQHI